MSRSYQSKPRFATINNNHKRPPSRSLPTDDEDTDQGEDVRSHGSNNFKKYKKELFSKRQYEVESDRDLFRQPKTVVEVISTSKVDEAKLFDFVFHLWTQHGLTPQQSKTIIDSSKGQKLLLQAFTHYSYLPQDLFHESNDYLERMGTYILDQHVQKHFLMTQGKGIQKGLQEKFTLMLAWFEKKHKAVPFADQIGLTDYIRWSCIQMKNDHSTGRLILLTDVVKWSVFCAFVSVSKELIDDAVGPGVGELVVNSLLKECWQTFDLNIEEMQRYKDDKSQITELHNVSQRFFLDDTIETVNKEKIYKVRLSLNSDMKHADTFTYFLGHDGANKQWKLPVCTDIKLWLKKHKIEWGVY